MASKARITVRAPLSSSTASKDAASLSAPPTSFLEGTWHVTHSTLPMWKGKQNVRITYTPLPASASTSLSISSPVDSIKLDDLVTYNAAGSTKTKSVRGIDTPGGSGQFHWRGRGWLRIASSTWEVLGWGVEVPGSGAGAVTTEDGDADQGDGQEANAYVVTYFASTLFTPAGIDIYSRHPGGLKPVTVSSIKEALKGVEDERVRTLSGTLFEVGKAEKEDGFKKKDGLQSKAAP